MRQAVFGSIFGLTTSLFSTDRIVFPNQPNPDLSETPRVPFVKVAIKVGRTSQMALGPTPPARYRCSLQLTYYSGVGVGSKNFNEFIDLTVLNFQTKTIYGIVFGVVEPYELVEGKGWAYQTVSIPFYFDTIT